MFLQFVNMLINDATYLLDEVLQKLGEVQTIEQEMRDRTRWEAMSEVKLNAQYLVWIDNTKIHFIFCVL